ncbi:MAG: ASCH domain-containing protein [Anaerolineales bacterium]|nr:ASCH domain-containing protein [Anaerolineales bacterium]
MDSNKVTAFWQSCLNSLPPDQHPENTDLPEAWGFGSSPQMADELGQLVYDGIKTATASLVWEYEAEGEMIPKPGDLSIILNGRDEPICLIETTEIRILPFDEVEPGFANDEGEGDRSLAYWRKAHWWFFGETCKAINRKPSQHMPVVCERFRLIYKR